MNPMFPDLNDNYKKCTISLYLDSPSTALEKVLKKKEGRKFREVVSGKSKWIVFTSFDPNADTVLLLAMFDTSTDYPAEQGEGDYVQEIIEGFLGHKKVICAQVESTTSHDLKSLPRNGIIKSLAGVTQSLSDISLELNGAQFSVDGANVSDFSWTTDSGQALVSLKAAYEFESGRLNLLEQCVDNLEAANNFFVFNNRGEPDSD